MQEKDGALFGTRWTLLAEALEREPHDGALPDGSGATPAAVLLLLYDKDGETHTVLTRRTSHLAAHKGEISLPGGAYEEDKDPTLLHTAVREAVEEVGIEAAALHVLGRLPTVHTMSSNYAIAPYVAATAQRPIFRPDPFEVAEVLEIPLAALRAPEALREEEWEIEGSTRIISFFGYREHKIWGATHRILTEFLTVLEAALPDAHP